jgi:putative cell wall-binding protein
MNKHIGLAIGVAAACTFPVLAQTGSPAQGTDTLSALLVEVRALRLAMERAATTTPQIQLLAARIGVANERLASATREANTVRQELEQVVLQTASLSSRVAEIEEALTRETDQVKHLQMKREQAEIKMMLEHHGGQEMRLRAREAELSNLAAAEHTQWVELNRRVDQVEQELAGRRPPR